jgi:L-ascorbate metabolism protein UlaG (beta-lactamase superfamily)
MTNSNVYLRQNVLAEPLFNQWYAWSGLIFPATAAMYIANSHIKIMQSFVNAPQVHVAAVKNPKMLGGPFMNHDESKAPVIRRLLDQTHTEQSHMIRLADGIKQLSEMLESEATGMSLEPLYEKVPDPLKGYVELVYDLNNHPSARFIEGLLYSSPYYNPIYQSISFSLIRDDNRPFVFSTPRLESEDHVQIDIPFTDERLDELFKMKRSPKPLGQAKELLGVAERDDALFSSLFTESPPRQAERYEGSGIRVRYMGHACVLIESKSTSILTDPVIGYEIEGGIERHSYADLPDSIDYVLITHGHQDHCMFETLLQLRHKVKNVVAPRSTAGVLTDPSLKLVLNRIGFKNVIELDEMESLAVEGGEILGLPFLGEHADLNIRTKMAHLVRLEGASMVFAADSNNIEPRMYQHIHETTGDIDVLFIGMECDGAPLSWIYGSLLTKPLARKMDQSRRLNGSDFDHGIRIVDQLNPKQVYVYAMGQEPWMTHVTAIRYTQESRPIIESDKLVAECLSRGLASERLFGKKEIIFE